MSLGRRRCFVYLCRGFFRFFFFFFHRSASFAFEFSENPFKFSRLLYSDKSFFVFLCRGVVSVGILLRRSFPEAAAFFVQSSKNLAIERTVTPA